MRHISAVASLLLVALCITTVSSSQHSRTFESLSASVNALNAPPSFQSLAWKHMEHVEWYQLDHQDQHLYNTKSVHRGEGLLSHVTYPYASRRMHMYEGMQLHFPKSLTLSVKAVGQTFHLNLHLVTELKSADTEILVSGERHPVTLSTYRTIPTQAGDIRATVTFRKDGSFQALLITKDEVIGIDPVEAHAQEMEASHYHSMATSAPHGMVAYKFSDAKATHTHECGLKDIHKGVIKSEPLTPQEMRRHLLATPINDPADGICNGVPCRWLDNGSGAPCWPGITATNVKSMTVSVLADYGYTLIWGNSANTIAAIDQMYAVVNSIYVPQIGIFCKLTQYVVMSAGAGSSGAGTLPNTNAAWNYAWNRAPASAGSHCDTDGQGYDINTYLNDITTYNKQDVSGGNIRFAERHALTNCFPPAGTVGLAWLGTIAVKSGQATGVSSYSSSHFLTVAHEQGHNLGGVHTFGPDGTSQDPSLGTGQMGGIMDYTDTGKYPRPESGKPGIVQFHPVLTRPLICKQLTTSMSDTAQSRYMSTYFQTWTPTCGNNVLEPGEACDDTSGCCDLTTCQLVAGGQCTPGNNNSPCCDSTCLYRSTRYGCPGGNSYCLMGKCAADGCTKFSNTAQCPATAGTGILQYQATSNPQITYPGIGYADGCNFGCSFGSGCGSNGQGFAQASSFGSVPDGAICTASSGSVTYGVCSGGGDGSGTAAKCVKATPPTPPTKYNPGATQAPTSAPTTQAPATPAPTTPAPTTRAPTTPAPTTPAPTTRAPTTAAPTTRAPTTAAPTTRAPATTQAPTTRAPTAKPTTKAPTKKP